MKKKQEDEKPQVTDGVVQSISKAVYNKSGVTVEYTEAVIVEGKAAIKSVAINNPTIPHPDLIMSLRILLPHFIYMSPLAVLYPAIDDKYIKSRKVVEVKKEDKSDPINIFEINGVNFSGVEGTNDYAVQIIGRLVYPNGKVISMVLPPERLLTEGGYSLKEQLVEDINSFIDEIDKFTNEGKALQATLELKVPVAETEANGNDER